MSFPPRALYTVPMAHGGDLHLGERCLVMGILNVTPDSFAETHAQLDPDAAIAAGLRMQAEGADIIDVGGESTRPGAEPVTADEELTRVLDVVGGLARRARIPISIDTYKAKVARAAVAAGASIINDVSALQYDAGLASVAAETGAALILMHMRGRPPAMYADAHYDDLVGEVAAELRARIAVATAAGVAAERIIVDPGIGFAKRPAHSYGVLARLDDIAAALDRPILVGPSRKSFMREAIGDRPPAQRDWGSAAAVAAAVLHGAHVVRVHAVAEMVQAVRVADEVRRAARQSI